MAESDDKESKTEPASEKKIRDAIEKGNVPFSREAGTFASLVSIIIILSFFLSSGVLDLTLSLERFVDNPGGWSLESSADAILIFQSIGLDAGRMIIPVVVLLTLAGLASSFLQNPPSVVVDRIQPDFSRISPTKGWKRIFGIQGQVEFLKATFKLVALGAVGFFSLRLALYDMLGAIHSEPSALPEITRAIAMRMLSAVTVAMLVLVAADLVWSRIHWHQELRMSRQEAKDELKQLDGDPIVKQRLRSIARDRARKRMIAAVPRATVVIANPTHYAVALRYVPEEGGAPLVLAKGQDLIALKIRQIAEEHGIPVIEDKLLARSLYKSVDVDKMIPGEFYKAVAEIIHFLMVRGRIGATMTRGQKI